MADVNLEDIRMKLYERLKPSGWADKLKTFLLSDYFMRILERLYKESQLKSHFTPELKYLFRAFEECPYKDLQLVFVGQSPYPYQNVADGVAFSCSRTPKIEKSLQYMFKEIEKQIYPDGGYVWDGDLKRWSNQGILMLNAALTTPLGKPEAHQELWKPFMAFLFDMLQTYNPGLVYVFTGNKAKEYISHLDERDEVNIITASHPASAAYDKLENWNSDNLFIKASDRVKKQFGTDIIW